MRVFVAGASGAVGRPLVRRLVEAGHEVTGTTRRRERADAIEADGGTGVVCDALDSDALHNTVAAASPEVVLHMLTALPTRINFRRDFVSPTNRLRTEGTRNLIAAARAAGARRVVSHSVAFFYEPRGGWVKEEDEPLFTDAPGYFHSAVEAVGELERQVRTAEGLEGTVLRYGWFYGPGTLFDGGGSQVEDVRKRRAPVVGAGTGTFSFVHIEDAAEAAVVAVESQQTGLYNVVDDEPAPMRDWLPVLAEALGARKPLRVPVWLARIAAGAIPAQMAIGLRGASNAKARRELGWQPRHPSWRQGFAEELAPA